MPTSLPTLKLVIPDKGLQNTELKDQGRSVTKTKGIQGQSVTETKIIQGQSVTLKKRIGDGV